MPNAGDGLALALAAAGLDGHGTGAAALSLTYGAVLTALSMLIAVLFWRYGMAALYLGLATGFIFIGPVLAVGLYSISLQLGKGKKPVMGYCLREGWHHIRELLVLGMVLLVVMLLWAGLIGLSVVIGFATALVGFTVLLLLLLPLIGHATWHAYLDTIDASIWPQNEASQRGHF